MDIIGLDVGYDSTKGANSSKTMCFESAAGTQFDSMHSMLPDGITFQSPAKFAVGGVALRYAKHLLHSKNLQWYATDLFYWLYLAGISELTTDVGDVTAVVGLPISTYRIAKKDVEGRLSGVHTFQRTGRQAQTVAVRCHSFPQAFGVACDEMLNDAGMVDSEFAGRRVGIIDIGGKTTNLLWLEKFRDVPHKTECLNLGCWNIIAEMIALIQSRTGRVLSEYDAREVLQSGRLQHDGKTLECEQERTSAIASVMTPLMTDIGNLWPDAHALDRIYLSGGGAFYLGKQLTSLFPQAVQAKNPIFSNAIGFAKFGRGFLMNE